MSVGGRDNTPDGRCLERAGESRKRAIQQASRSLMVNPKSLLDQHPMVLFHTSSLTTLGYPLCNSELSLQPPISSVILSIVWHRFVAPYTDQSSPYLHFSNWPWTQRWQKFSFHNHTTAESFYLYNKNPNKLSSPLNTPHCCTLLWNCQHQR